MIELVDNLIQLTAVLSGFAVSGVCYLKSRRQPYFLLCCSTASLAQRSARPGAGCRGLHF